MDGFGLTPVWCEIVRGIATRSYMYDLVQHDQSSIYSPLVQWAPTKFPEPLNYTGSGPVVMDSPHGRSTLGTEEAYSSRGLTKVLYAVDLRY